ncbi:MAG: YitT family protein [Pygmaiobacter sp.]
MRKRDGLRREIQKMVYFVAGNIFYALAIQLFLAGNSIAAGGFSGIAIVLASVLPISIGSFVFLLNLPFLIISFFVKGKSYTLKTLLGSSIYAVLLDLISFLPTATHNKLVAAVFGGLLYGIGAVLFMKSEASGGGTDLVARLLKVKFPSMSIGSLFIAVDGCVVVFAMVMFHNIEAGLYAIITIYVCSVVNDRTLSGFDKANMCYIITDNDPDSLSLAIQQQLGRSVTLQRGVGMYAKSEHNILMTVLRPRETWDLKQIVKEMDPSAFVVMASASEVLGRGFKGIADETPPDALSLHALAGKHKTK